MKKWMPYAFLAAAGGVAAWYFGRSGAKPAANPLASALSKLENGAGQVNTGQSLQSIFNSWLRAGSGSGGASAPAVSNPAPAVVNTADLTKAIGITAGPALAAAPVAKAFTPLPPNATLAQALAMPELQASPAALASFQGLSLLGGNVADNYAAAMKAAM